MCNLNCSADTKIKHLNLDLLYKGRGSGYPVFVIRIQNVISQPIFETKVNNSKLGQFTLVYFRLQDFY